MKAALHYVFLVGIPVLMVFILLQVGERYLTAPVDVNGQWVMNISSPPSELSCGPLRLDFKNPILTISQSGLYLVLTFNDARNTALSGMISEQTIQAHFHDHSGEMNSQYDLSITIMKEVETDQLHLDGRLEVAPCGESWSFTATRLPEDAQVSTGGH